MKEPRGSVGEVLAVFTRLGLTSFGGPMLLMPVITWLAGA